MIEPASADPDACDAREWMRLARAGDLAGAWAVSDRIRARNGPTRDDRVPRHLQCVWDGSPLDGRRVLVRCYHGLGDTIQFIRYAPLLAGVARQVSVWAQPALLDLLAIVPGIDRLLPLHDGTPDVGYDVDVELMELPCVFRTTLPTIPAHVPYLRAVPADLPGRGPRIGVVWRAGDWDPRRSVPFASLAPLLESGGATWYGLQLDPRADEVHEELLPLDTRGIDRLAQAIAAMDLVITIDSMSAHLAGALAVPVWTLLPRDADWRWMEERDDSPWYPTMRLFRQRASGGWSPVVSRVLGALGEIRQSAL